MGGVDVVRNRNKTDSISGKHPPQVAPGFDVFPPQAGKVFDYDAVDLAIGNTSKRTGPDCLHGCYSAGN